MVKPLTASDLLSLYSCFAKCCTLFTTNFVCLLFGTEQLLCTVRLLENCGWGRWDWSEPVKGPVCKIYIGRLQITTNAIHSVSPSPMVAAMKSRRPCLELLSGLPVLGCCRKSATLQPPWQSTRCLCRCTVRALSFGWLQVNVNITVIPHFCQWISQKPSHWTFDFKKDTTTSWKMLCRSWRELQSSFSYICNYEQHVSRHVWLVFYR